MIIKLKEASDIYDTLTDGLKMVYLNRSKYSSSTDDQYNCLSSVMPYYSLFCDYYRRQESYNKENIYCMIIKDDNEKFHIDFTELNIAVSLKYQVIDILHELRFSRKDNDGQEEFITLKKHRMLNAKDLDDEIDILYEIKYFFSLDDFKYTHTIRDFENFGYKWSICTDL